MHTFTKMVFINYPCYISVWLWELFASFMYDKRTNQIHISETERWGNECAILFIVCECESMFQCDSWDLIPHAPVKKDLYFILYLWLTFSFIHLLKCKIQKKMCFFPTANFKCFFLFYCMWSFFHSITK